MYVAPQQQERERETKQDILIMGMIQGNSPELVSALEKAGIVPVHCKRIIIDIDYDYLITLYYECYADKKILSIDFAKYIGAMITEEKDKPVIDYGNDTRQKG